MAHESWNTQKALENACLNSFSPKIRNMVWDILKWNELLLLAFN